MAIKRYKPTSPARRFMTVSAYAELTGGVYAFDFNAEKFFNRGFYLRFVCGLFNDKSILFIGYSVVSIDKLEVKDGKTKEMVAFQNALKLDKSAVIVMDNSAVSWTTAFL